MALNYNIISTNSLLFNQFKQLYLESFPVDERRDIVDIERLMLHDSHYTMHGITRDGQLLGFVTTWNFGWCLYVEHFAIMPHERGQGLGSQMLDMLTNRWRQPIVLEVEPPTTTMAKRRVSFYRRNGYRPWPTVPYVQPPYTPKGNAVPLMLMTRGLATVRQVKQAAQVILRRVYGQPLPH